MREINFTHRAPTGMPVDMPRPIPDGSGSAYPEVERPTPPSSPAYELSAPASRGRTELARHAGPLATADLGPSGESAGSPRETATPPAKTAAPGAAATQPETARSDHNYPNQTEGSAALDILSADNLEALRRSFAAVVLSGKMTAPPAVVAAKVHKAEVELATNHALTINLSSVSMERLCEVGRVETYWGYADQVNSGVDVPTANGKMHHTAYSDYRRAVEEGMQPYAPTEHQDNHPVYAAVAGPKDAHRGAAPAYGEWWVELDQDVADGAVYHFSDSHSSVDMQDNTVAFDTGSLLNHRDAVAAKAICDAVLDHNGRTDNYSLVFAAEADRLIEINGLRPRYVEAAVFEPVTLDTIAAVGVYIGTAEQLHDATPLLSNPPKFLQEKLTVHISDTLDPHAADWLRANFSTEQVATKNTNTTPTLWDELGVDANSSYEEVAQAIDREAKKLWPVVRRHMYGISSRFIIPGFKSASGWHNHTNELRQKTETMSGTTREQFDKFIALQQARVFFKPQANA